MTQLLNISTLENLDIKKPFYSIGVDTYDEKNLAYCLSRSVNGVVEILLCKTMKDKKPFEEEVENLSKYFNACVIKEC